MSALFKIDQSGLPAGIYGRARQDLSIGSTITFTAEDASPPIFTYLWELISEPPGSTVVVGTPTAQSCTVTLSETGGYLMRLTVDAGLPSEDIQVLYFGVALAGSGLCIPAFNETYFDNSQPPYTGERGYEEKLTNWIKWVDGNSGKGIRKPKVIDIVDCTQPPPTENDGDRYILDNTLGTIDAGWDGGDRTNIMQYDLATDTWSAEVPEEGWRCLVDALNTDAVFVDDPPTAAYWEVQPIASNLWTTAAGTSAIKRTDNTTGTAAGDYAVNAGWGGQADADYSFHGGNSCIIDSGSINTAVFGYNNILGGVIGSPNSIITGRNNIVSGADDHGTPRGDNAVFGSDNDVLEGGNVVGGSQNIARQGYVAVFGYGNNVQSNCSLVGGIFNDVDGYDNFVAGDGNEVYSAQCGAIGAFNVINASCDKSFVGGSENILGNSVASEYSFVYGRNNDVDADSVGLAGFNVVIARSCNVDGDYNAVFGYNHTVPSDYSAVFGYQNSLTKDPVTLLGGSVVGGRSNTVTGDYNTVVGYNNSVGQTTPGLGLFVGGQSNIVNGVLAKGEYKGWTFVMGQGNDVSMNEGIVAGSSNIVWSTNPVRNTAVFGTSNWVGAYSDPAGNCIVAGEQNDIDGMYNSVFGYANLVVGYWNGNLVGGEYNEVNGNDNLVGGVSNSVTLSSNIVAGSYNDVDGDWCAVFGSGNTAGGAGATGYSVIAGSGNTWGTYYSVVFGESNTIGATYLSGHSLVHGYNNSVEGDSVNEYGYNYVFGNSHDVDGDYNAVFGYSHDVNNNYCAVFGNDHTIGATIASVGSVVGGYSHDVDGGFGPGVHGYNTVFGYDHNIDGDMNGVFGRSHTIIGHSNLVGGSTHTISGVVHLCVIGGELHTINTGSLRSAIFGSQNTIGATYGSPASLIAGGFNTVDGSSSIVGYNCVVAYAADVDGDYNAVFGSDQTVAGDYNAVFGYSHVVPVDASAVFGYDHTLASGSDYCLVGGQSHTVGATVLSAHSIVVGWGHAVNGYDDNKGGFFGYNAVFGETHNITGKGNVVGGGNNYIGPGGPAINTNYNAVFGANHVIYDSGLNLVSGQSNYVNSNFNVVGGQDQNIYVGSDWCVLGGYGHIVGNTYGSNYSLVAGSLNSVDGSSSEIGFNCVVGDSCNIDGDYNAVFGLGHTVASSYNLVSGNPHTIYADSDYCVVGGYGHTIGLTDESPYSAVFGQSHSVDGAPGGTNGHSIVAGQFHVVSGFCEAVFGGYNTVGSAGGETYNIVAGSDHTVVGEWNAVFGYLQEVYKQGNAVFGSTNYVNSFHNVVGGEGQTINLDSDYCVVGGYGHTIGATTECSYSAVFGESNVVDGGGTSRSHNIVAGETHDVDISHSAVFGLTNTVLGTTSGAVIVAGELNSVTGDYNAVFGLSNTIGAEWSVASGNSNNIYGGSDYCAVFGDNNGIGFLYDSPHTAVFGDSNGVDGSVANEIGCNVVGGYYNSIGADYSAVFGYANTLHSDYSFVAGGSNSIGVTIDAPYSVVFGQNNTVNGFNYLGTDYGHSLVHGALNSVTSFGSIVIGQQNTISASYTSTFTAVFGYQNTVGVNADSNYSIVAGFSHDVDGKYCAVFGVNNVVLGDWNLIGGNANGITGGRNVFGGLNSSVVGDYNVGGGESQDVTGGHNIVAGYAHDVASDYCAIFGNYNVVGATYGSHMSLVAGYWNTVDGSSSAIGRNCVVGEQCNVDGDYNAVFGYGHSAVESYALVYGKSAKANWFGQMAFSGFAPSTSYPGESQNNLFSASCECLGDPAAFTQLYPDGHGGSKDLLMQVDGSYYFHFAVLARKKGQGATEQTASWYGRVMAQRDSGGSGLVASASVTPDFATSNGDESSWGFQVSVDGSHNIVFEGKGSADATNPTYFQLMVWGPNVNTTN